MVSLSRRALLLCPAAAAKPDPVEPADEFGGWSAHPLPATGRFRLAQWKQGSWLVTPRGHPLIVVGLCHTHMAPPELRVPGDCTAERFAEDEQAYARDTVAWMRAAGFNTFSYPAPRGAERDANRLGDLNLLPGFIREPLFPDVFDGQWRAAAAKKIAQLVPAMARDPRVMGYVLSTPQLFSPAMERPGIWRNGMAPRNWMMAIKALPAGAAGKHAYMAYLRRTYADFAAYRVRRGAPAGAAGFDDLLRADLSVSDPYADLHLDDAAFYREMWSGLTAFLAREIRRHDPHGLIFSYRFIRVVRWPDPWMDAMLRGVAPHVEAFTAELYGEHACREIVDGIGRSTGKPTLLADGMRTKEFVYRDEADDRAEADGYECLFRSLAGSPWYLGGCVCQYQDRLPDFPWYSPRPREARTGIRNPDYTDRAPLLARFRKLHFAKYSLRLQALEAARGTTMENT